MHVSLPKYLFLGLPFESAVFVGVGNKPSPISSVWSVDGTSWKYIREYFVPRSFQISLHFVEYQPA